MTPTFLTVDDVLALHADQITTYGGSPGLRDLGLLQSAVAMPEATFGGMYLHATIAEMASAYLFHLTANHAFVDGNKRIGLASAFTFLAINGYDLSADKRALGDLVLGVAGAKLTKAEVAVFLAKHIKKRRRRR